MTKAIRVFSRGNLLSLFALALFTSFNLSAGTTVLVEDTFDGASGAGPNATKFTWSGEVMLNGSGQVNLQTVSANTSWLRSQAGAAVAPGETLRAQFAAYAYAEGTSPGVVYGDRQPRGLRVGTDANNAVEFYSASRTSVGMRTRKAGVETAATFSLPAGVDSMHQYEITVTTTSAVFRVDGTLAATITNNLPTGSLNFHASTYDGGFGNVPAQLDAVLLSLSNSVVLIAPSVTTAAASEIVATGTNAVATLNGAVNPNDSTAAAWFEWGRTRAYGNLTSTLNVTNNSAVSATVNLQAGFPYHFRVVASNSTGCTYGKDQVFWSPRLELAGSAVLTNAYGVSFVEPGVGAKGAPLAIAVGFGYCFALKADRTLANWGRYSSPEGLTNVVAICAGDSVFTALSADGTITNWGFVYSPPAITSNIVTMANGSYHGLLLLSNGIVTAWGPNNSGATNVPAGLTNVITLAAGGDQSFALDANGHITQWGNVQAAVPADATNVIALAAGAYHTLALRPNGTVAAWGYGSNGQTNVPADLTNAIAVAAGGHHSMALRANGQLAGWGMNSYGEITFPAAATNMVEIAMGYYNSGGIREDGTVLAWGLNNYNQTVVPTNLMDLSFAVSTQGIVDSNTPGAYTLTYWTTNQLGAVATATRTVVVAAPDFFFMTNAGAIRITGYKGSGGTVIIPGSIYGYPVTTIGSYAFESISSISNLLIPDSVTSLEYRAFYRCTGLRSVTIPESVTTIGLNAFAACTSLAGVTIPNSVTYIGSYAFLGCPALTNISVGALNPNFSSLDGVLFNKDQTTLIQCPGGKPGSYIIPNSVINVGDSAFSNCGSLTNIAFGSSVASLGVNAFAYCPGLSSVTLPDTVTSVGDGTFSSCTNLTSVTTGNGVTSIASGMFSSCSRLSSVTFGSNVTSIGGGAFGDCSSLTNITIPNSVTSIGAYAFGRCTNLRNVVLGTGLISIMDGVFQQCSSLTSLTIPAGVVSVGDWALAHCTGLTRVFFQGNAPSLGGGSVFYNTSSATVYYLPDTRDWTSTLGGRPTALWNPAMQSLVFQTNGFESTITGTANIPFVVEVCTNLDGGGVWVPLQTNTLTSGSLPFTDPSATNRPASFYRLRWP